MIDPSVIALVSAATALVASITGPMAAVYVGRAQIKATVRSGNRQKWIEEFRDLTAHFCGHLSTSVQLRHKVIADGRIILPEEGAIVAYYDRMMYTAAKLKLVVNPLDDQHLKLMDIITVSS